MNEVILQDIVDVFQIEGRGTVVTGPIGPGWKTAKRGDKIELRTPDGQSVTTAIKDMELLRKGEVASESVPSRGVLLADIVASEHLPSGTKMLKIND
jgi:translation elongation factor EF-Tu-like GTPase